MSITFTTEILCDACERSEYFSGTSVRSARASAKKMGWLVNLKPAPGKPALFSTRRDLCPSCKGER